MRTFTMLMGLAMIAGCPEPATPDAAENAEADVEAPVDEPKEAEGQDEAAADAATPEMAPVTVADLNAGRADHMGKDVIVAGMFGGTAAEGEMVHVTVLASGEEGAESLMCASSEAAAWDGMEDKAELTVKGKVAEADGKTVLENCMKHDAKAAEMEEGSAEGEAAGEEGDAAEGAEAEGAEAEAEAQGEE